MQSRSFNMLPPVVKNLLIINGLFYMAQHFLPSTIFNIEKWLVLMPFGTGFMPHQLVSYMFLHSTTGLWHILFNMFALWMFGKEVENTVGSKRFIQLYFFCGIGAGLIHLLVSSHPVLGASGAVYGVLTAYGVLYPNQKLMLLFPPIPMKAKYFILLIIAFDLFQGFSGANNGIANFAHVGGALFGFLYMQYLKMTLKR